MNVITLNKTQKAKVVNAMIDRVRDQFFWSPSNTVDGLKVRWCFNFEQSMLELEIAEALGLDQVDLNNVDKDDAKEIIGGYMPLVKITRGVEWVDDEE